MIPRVLLPRGCTRKFDSSHQTASSFCLATITFWNERRHRFVWIAGRFLGCDKLEEFERKESRQEHWLDQHWPGDGASSRIVDHQVVFYSQQKEDSHCDVVGFANRLYGAFGDKVSAIEIVHQETQLDAANDKGCFF